MVFYVLFCFFKTSDLPKNKQTNNKTYDLFLKATFVWRLYCFSISNKSKFVDKSNKNFNNLQLRKLLHYKFYFLPCFLIICVKSNAFAGFNGAEQYIK